MKTKIIFLIIVLFVSSVSYSQSFGKIFTKEEAVKLYGDVTQTIGINIFDLNSIISNTQKYVMFNIIDGELIILGDGRKVLYPVNRNVNSAEIFAVYSKSRLLELLSNGNGNQVAFEKRSSNRPTISYGLNTMEEAGLCPPFCD